MTADARWCNMQTTMEFRSLMWDHMVFILEIKMITRLEVEIGNLFPCAWAAIKTFGELKEKIVLDIKK